MANENKLGENSELLPIGAKLPDLAPTRKALDTNEVTAAIENIALEETVAKTSVTIGTQTTFTQTKQKYDQSNGDSDTDTDFEPTKAGNKKKLTDNGPKSPWGEFKTKKFGLKKQCSS